MDNDLQHIAHYRKVDKESQSLEAHLLGVGALARSHAEKIGLSDQGELLGILHDLGKYSATFQAYIKSAVGLLNQDEDEEFVDAGGLRGKIDHSTAGAQLVWRELSKQGQIGQIVGQILSLCIASHHSGLIDCLSSDTSSLGEDVYGIARANAGLFIWSRPSRTTFIPPVGRLCITWLMSQVTK